MAQASCSGTWVRMQSPIWCSCRLNSIGGISSSRPFRNLIDQEEVKIMDDLERRRVRVRYCHGAAELQTHM